MNLRKALDKARQMRGEDPAPPPRPAVMRPAPIPGTDWKAPVYAESNRVEVDERALFGRRCVCIEPDTPELEHYKVLRTKIQLLLKEKGWRTVMITSPGEAEGKTLTAVNLALTFAKAYNQTVMLVDCDLRRQAVHRLLGYENGLGLGDFLTEERPLKDFIVWPGVEQMTVISGGRTVANGAELIGSARMKALMHDLKCRYDDRVILFDAPPALVGADALALAALVDCFVMVVADGRTGMGDVKKALGMLPQAKFLGYVLNFQKEPAAKYCRQQ